MTRDDRTWFSFAAAYTAPLLLLGLVLLRQWRQRTRAERASAP